MRLPSTAAGAAITLALLLVGCTTAPPEQSPTPQQTQDASPSQSAEPTPASSPGAPESPSSEQGVAGTTVHFTAGDAVVEVVIEEDNPTTRSFVAMLPMTVEFSDFGGKEKVATPTGEWDFTDAVGLDSEAGDLFSYMSRGNLGLFCKTDGNTFSNALTKIGETEDIDRIELLDGRQVTIAVSG